MEAPSGGGRAVRPRGQRPRRLSLTGAVAAAAAAGVVTAVAALAAVASASPPLILIHPAPRVSVPWGETATLSVAAVSGGPGGGRGGLTYQWQARSPATGAWTNLRGERFRTLTATNPCPGLRPAAYRVVVASGARVADAAAADRATSRPSVWSGSRLSLIHLLGLPPVALRVTPGAAGAARWTVRHPAEGALVWGEVRLTKADGGQWPAGGWPPGVTVSRQEGWVGPSMAVWEVAWTAAAATAAATSGFSGTRMAASVRAYCPGAGTAPVVDSRKSLVVVAGPPRSGGGGGGGGRPAPTPPACVGIRGVAAADYDGWLLNDGTRVSTGSCGGCERLCRSTPGCNVWVWGRPGGGAGRDRQCWVKRRRAGAGEPPVVAGRPPMNKRPTGVWLSGYIPLLTTKMGSRTPNCSGRWGVDVDGEVVGPRGDANLQPTCVACAVSCRSTPGCNVWVWGYKGFRSDRHRQCWLKRVADVDAVVYKAGSFAADNPWLSGIIRRR